MEKIKLARVSDGEACDFAILELSRYLEEITGHKAVIQDRDGLDMLSVGLFADLDIEGSGHSDAIYISTIAGHGIIAGSNPCSVLMAVYRYLFELGCRWVRPGESGEYLPRINFVAHEVNVNETASYDHRGICIEGAVSLENVLDMIAWAPKLGFNSYFMQFREGFIFFDRWYSHRGNPLLPAEDYTVAQARHMTEIITGEIKKRGLLFHAAGHGWTCEPFGIGGLGWDAASYDLPEETTKHLALVNGKREIWKGVALDTNLCYSNPLTRRIVIEDIATYMDQHPSIDLLHFWLSDGTNNACECAECSIMSLSDYYVVMLNELDGLLTERRIDRKIVFLIYVDLLWAPDTERIVNKNRFILMFAPITRTYSRPFSPSGAIPVPPAYMRNKLEFPVSVEENLAFLRKWQKQFRGDSFIFDYHLMWDHLKDPGHASISRTIYEDVRNLRELGINGYVSCQLQRLFLPDGLPMTVLGNTLWNREASYPEIVDRYYSSTFNLGWRFGLVASLPSRPRWPSWL